MGKRQFQKKALQAVQSPSLSAAGNGIYKKHLPNNTDSTNVSSMHRGRKRRQQALERQQRRQSFIEAELAKIDQIASDKCAAAALAKRNNINKKRAASFKGLGLDLGQVLNQLSDDKERQQCDQSPVAGKGEEKKKKKQLRHRNWATVVNDERDQMQRVTQHDAFVGMGVEALRAHLTNTVMSSSSAAAAAPTTNNDVKKGTAATAKRSNNNNKSDELSSKQNNNKMAKRDDQHNTDEAQSVAAQRRAFKKRQAEQLLEMGAEKRGDVKRQTFGSLLGGVKKQKEDAQLQRRGRIGDKRPKNLT